MKIDNYIWISLTMMLLFQFAGYTTTFSPLFDLMNINFDDTTFLVNSTDIEGSSIVTYFFAGSTGLFALIALAGVTIGLFGFGARADIALKAGLAAFMFVGFTQTLIFPLAYALYNGLADWSVALLSIVFIPFTILFLVDLTRFVIGGTSD